MEQLAEIAGARAVAGSLLSRRRLWAVVGALPLGFALVLFEVLAFRSGGYIPTSAAPVVIAFCVVLAIWAGSRPRLADGRLLAIGLLALGAFAVWSGVSTLWSVGPDLSWISFNYATLFTLVAASCVLCRPGVWGLRLAGFGFLAAMLPVALYAFLGKALPDVVTHAHLFARLAQPVGYWNVLAILMVMAVPVALAATVIPARSGDTGNAGTRHESFDRDPGWEGHNNRIVPSRFPVITQDFGYSDSNHAGTAAGELGGQVWRAAEPAYYADRVGPRTLVNKLSASGSLIPDSLATCLARPERAVWRKTGSISADLAADQPPFKTVPPEDPHRPLIF